MSDPFIAEVVIFAGSFAPRGWAYCDGQIQSIAQNSALFSLLGTTYGGDGRSTFGLPDLRGRVAIGPRNGPGLSSYALGERGGAETVILQTTQIPSHKHALHGETALANSNNPKDNMLALPALATPIYAAPTPTTDKVMANESIQNTGGGQGHSNIQPFLAINYIIALQGVYPSRN